MRRAPLPLFVRLICLYSWCHPRGGARSRLSLLPGQGPGRGRRHPRQYAGRLWPGGRPQPHRRLASKHPVHPASLQTMLERLGVNTRGATMQTKNVAAVMVTANLPAFCLAGFAHRRDGVGHGRRQDLLGRHACWSRRCSAPTARSMRWRKVPVAIGGFSAQGDAASGDARRAHRRAHLQRRHCRTRDRFSLWPTRIS